MRAVDNPSPMAETATRFNQPPPPPFRRIARPGTRRFVERAANPRPLGRVLLTPAEPLEQPCRGFHLHARRFRGRWFTRWLHGRTGLSSSVGIPGGASSMTRGSGVANRRLLILEHHSLTGRVTLVGFPDHPSVQTAESVPADPGGTFAIWSDSVQMSTSTAACPAFSDSDLPPFSSEFARTSPATHYASFRSGTKFDSRIIDRFLVIAESGRRARVSVHTSTPRCCERQGGRHILRSASEPRNRVEPPNNESDSGRLGMVTGTSSRGGYRRSMLRGRDASSRPLHGVFLRRRRIGRPEVGQM